MSNPVSSPSTAVALLVQHVTSKLTNDQLAALNLSMALDSDPRDTDGFALAKPLFTDTRTDADGHTYPAASQSVKAVFAAVTTGRLAG